jgi:hypothetical protein
MNTAYQPTGWPLPAVCGCGTSLVLCPGCDDARCYSCDPHGTSDCDDTSYPPCAEEVPA